MGRCKTRAHEVQEEDINTINELKELVMSLKIENETLKARVEWQDIQLMQDTKDIQNLTISNDNN